MSIDASLSVVENAEIYMRRACNILSLEVDGIDELTEPLPFSALVDRRIVIMRSISGRSKINGS